MSEPLVLGIESSCDETSAALLRGNRILGHVILSQDVHRLYGGVVPELAARAHLGVIGEVVRGALEEGGASLGDLDAIGVTAGPGLIGGLLVGVSWARGAAFGLGIPLIPVHHMEAHLFAPSLENPRADPPFVALLVSGGHTLLLHAEAWGRYHLLGETRDDAAGEAYDKVAKLVGLPYPGGPVIERIAREGDPARHPFPRPMLRRNARPGDADYFDVSFSGLKTAVAERVREVEEKGQLEAERAHLAAGFQEAVVEVLAAKVRRAIEATETPRVLIGGGVAANARLREALGEVLPKGGELLHASPRLSLDNGAMVARVALHRLREGWDAADEGSVADASLPFPGLVRAA